MSYNVGLEMVNCYTKYFDHQENNLHGLIDKLATTNNQIKIVSDLINKLSHARKKDQETDFLDDATLKRYIAYVHLQNPTIFEGIIQGFPDYLPETSMTGSTLSLEEMLKESLKHIDLSGISISPLSEDQVDIVVQGLDGQLKAYNADLNEHMMHINKLYDDRSQMTECGRKVVETSSNLLDHINRKMTS